LFLSAFLAYLLSRKKHKIAWMFVSGVFYAASLLAKETTIVLPGLVLAHALLYRPNQDTERTVEAGWWPKTLQAATLASVYVPILALYVALRIHVLQGFSHPQTELSAATLFWTAPSVVLFYLRQWFWPVRVSAFYDLSLRTQWDTVQILLPLLALAVFAVLLWRFRQTLGSREVAWSAAAMVLPLLPVLYVSVFPAGELVHDRYVYLPGLGAALLVALVLQPLCAGKLVFRLPQRLVLALLLVVVPLSYETASASSYWVDDLTLFEHAHEMAPANLLARNNYAVALSRDGQQGTAMTILEGLVKEHPNYYLANYNLGRLLYEVNLVNPAEHYLQQAKSIAPDRPDTYLQLGLLAVKTGRPEEALSNFRRAVALRPQDARIHFALGVVLAQGGQCVQARAEFSKALTLNPNFLKAKEQREQCGSAAQADGPAVPGNSGSSPVPRATPVAVPHGPLVTVQEVR
jgi:Tfp pilus assembly protein PilF